MTTSTEKLELITEELNKKIYAAVEEERERCRKIVLRWRDVYVPYTNLPVARVLSTIAPEIQKGKA